ncbi:MAG: leucyl aminopeptidase [Gammaproteobacteria bacterium]|nr:leucyl aminopeptidase [Gammaproteobacteria bacterium]
MQHFICENNLPASLDCLMVGILGPEAPLPEVLKTCPEWQDFYKHQAKELKKNGDWIWQTDSHQRHVIIFHCGQAHEYNAQSMKQSLKKILGQFKDRSWTSLGLYLPPVQNLSDDEKLHLTILTLESIYYQFLNYKPNDTKYALNSVYHILKNASKNTITDTMAIAKGIELCQNLANTPANDCTPLDLENVAKTLAKTHKNLKCTVHDEKDLKKMGMNTLLCVGQGSANPPRLIELHYLNGPKNQKPLMLIGKGITFDSGGISLKPAEGMFEMKFDMSGAASVMGVMKALALLELPINVIGLMACAENMPSGTAVRPGDVIKSHLGKTIEITNTDAEGRLVLADALSYGMKYDPKAIVDIATLTGAIIIALGHVYTGLMSPHDDLANSLLKASEKTLDKLWRLPMDCEFVEQLASPVADMVNSHGSREAGSIIAAHFLHAFAQQTPWAHLDIAGSAWISGKSRQATGRPVALLIEWIKNYHAKN